LISLHLFLADASSAATQPTVNPPWWANQSNMLFFVILGFLVLMIFSSSRTKKKEEKQRNDMLKGMKRGDKVLTIGGILGTLVDVRDTEVIVKVDEGSNTKIKFSREAIKRVVTDDESASK
jgi:preprotein translocase subunit YajC